jgi:hypothetical protein
VVTRASVSLAVHAGVASANSTAAACCWINSRNDDASPAFV